MVGLALLVSSCAQGLAFVQDDRLRITSPDAQQKVTLPVTVRWAIDDFEITGPTGNARKEAGYFGIFVDTSPVPPGQPLSWVARDDRRCKARPGCPDATYLADHRVYSTDDTTFTFAQLPDLDTYGGHETHEVTIILLDGAGRRIGESAWYRAFRFDRKKSQ